MDAQKVTQNNKNTLISIRKKAGYVKYLCAREFNKLHNYLCNIRGVDPITHTKIYKQDLLSIGNGSCSWVVPSGLLDHNSVCYCLGCGLDISFDLGLIDKYRCVVHAFDPTPASIEYCKKASVGNSKFNFHEYGVWHVTDTLKFYHARAENEIECSLVNIQKTDMFTLVSVRKLTDVLEELGHKYIDLIKIDIEGAEYELIQLIVDENVFIKVICIEYDEMFNRIDKKFINRIRHSVCQLKKAGYRLVADQGYGNFTFVHKSCL